MTNDDIAKLFVGIMAFDAFDILNASGVTPEQVEKAVDNDTAEAYENWIYFNAK